jgi:hypothetical protein
MSNLRTRNPIFPRMPANGFCSDPDSADLGDSGHFRNLRNTNSGLAPREAQGRRLWGAAQVKTLYN